MCLLCHFLRQLWLQCHQKATSLDVYVEFYFPQVFFVVGQAVCIPEILKGFECRKGF